MRIQNPGLFTTGLLMTLGGVAAASPLDEAAVALGTAGVGIAAAPIQGPVTLVGGIGTALTGIALMFVSTMEISSTPEDSA